MHNRALRIRRASMTLGIALAAGAPAAWAQGFMSQELIPPGQESVIIDLGGIVNRFDTNVRLDGQGSRGTDFNLESNGMEKNLSSFEAGLTWRIAQRHRFDVMYYSAERNGSRDYSTVINIGDTSFPVGANVSIKAQSDFANIDYRYSFMTTPEVEMAVLLGFYGGKFTWDIDAVGNSGGPSRTYHKSVSTTLPLPMLGLTLDWYPDPRWKAAFLVEGVKAKIGDVDGHAYILGASLEYMLVRNFGVGARYSYVDINADVTKNDFNGNFNWGSNSVSLYGKFVF